jgi:hypothetical protein
VKPLLDKKPKRAPPARKPNLRGCVKRWSDCESLLRKKVVGCALRTNQDGAPVHPTISHSVLKSISEVVPTGATAECPCGVFIIDAANGIGFSRATQTFPNGDQIYSQVLFPLNYRGVWPYAPTADWQLLSKDEECRSRTSFRRTPESRVGVEGWTPASAGMMEYSPS